MRFDERAGSTGGESFWGWGCGEDGKGVAGPRAEVAAFCLRRSLLLSGQGVRGAVVDAASNSIIVCCSVNALAFFAGFLFSLFVTLLGRAFVEDRVVLGGGAWAFGEGTFFSLEVEYVMGLLRDCDQWEEV